MSKVSLFFGDSLTSGDNNGGVSYVNYLADAEHTVINLGISGTTVGEYSIYPVDGYSLLSQVYNNKQRIEEADDIFLEYGLNDTAAILAYNVDMYKATIAFNKAIDAIKQMNSKAMIHVIIFKDVETIAQLQCDYLDKYLSGITATNVTTFCETYRALVSYFIYRSDDIILVSSFAKHLDEDKLHPNDKGYKRIAKEIKNACIDYRN